MFKTNNPALVVIDMQDAIDHFPISERSHTNAEETIAELLSYWRAQQRPIVHVRHSSKDPRSPYHSSSPWFAFKTATKPVIEEKIITKRENCAFIDTDLENYLHQQNITELVVVGVLLNHSVDVTVRVARGLGFRCFLVSDACPATAIEIHSSINTAASDTASRQIIEAKLAHSILLANLENEYATLIEAQTLLPSS